MEAKIHGNQNNNQTTEDVQEAQRPEKTQRQSWWMINGIKSAISTISTINVQICSLWH